VAAVVAAQVVPEPAEAVVAPLVVVAGRRWRTPTRARWW